MNRPGRELGIFIDGGFLDYLNGTLLTSSPKRQLSLAGLVDMTEREMGGRATQRHYVRGRVSSHAAIDSELVENDFTRHDTPVLRGREIGGDVTLALQAYARTRDHHLDGVLIMTADGDMAPLVAAICDLGVEVVVPYIDIPSPLPMQRGGGDRHKTSHLLQGGGAANPDLFTLADQAAVDPHALPLLTYPEGAAPGTIDNTKRRRGRISRVDPERRYAVIEEINGSRWYMPPQPLPGEERDAPMQTGLPVEFSGAPTPRPGVRYPHAYTVKQVQAGPGPTTHEESR